MTDTQQNIHTQTVLLEVVKAQGATNALLENLSKDIKKNDERTQLELTALKLQIEAVKKDVDALSDKAKYWKVAFCVIIGAGGIVWSIVQFGNDVVHFIKNFYDIKGR